MCLPLAFSGCGGRTALTGKTGGPFPDLRILELATPSDFLSLGLAQPGPFSLSGVPGEALVLEFFNTHCPACRLQASHLEELHRQVAEDPGLPKVRILAVGVGDRADDLASFRRLQDLSYPLVPDPSYALYGHLPDMPRTPVTLLLVRRGKGWVLRESLSGVHTAAEILGCLRAEAPPGRGAGRLVDTVFDPPLDLGDMGPREGVFTFLARVDPRVGGVAQREVLGHEVFEALGTDGTPLGLFGRIASRNPVCDVCHTVHFLMAFDRNGRVRAFEPIHAAKYGNQTFSASDTGRVRSRLEGRSMAGLPFDPEIDSVSGATLTVSAIFDEVRRTADLVEALRQFPDPP